MKMNKKGFTLIEMLVVIAIIAVLVSIIIPTVSNSTLKASAAANAANLRSLQAEMTTQMLISEDTFTAQGITFTKGQDGAYTMGATTNMTVTFKDLTATQVETSGFNADAGLAAAIDANQNVTVSYDGLTITQWGDLAG